MARGALPNPARLIDSVDASANTLTLDDHGFYDGDVVQFRVDTVDGALPSPLVEGVSYYVVRVSDSAFSVAASDGGAVVNLSSNGERTLVCAALPIQDAIDWASALVDENLPGHVVPLAEPYPEIVRMTAAELAVGKLASLTNAAPETLTKAVDAAQARLARWAKGVPVRSASVQSRANLSASASAPYRDSKGWRNGGVI
jgi:hypothetical protein